MSTTGGGGGGGAAGGAGNQVIGKTGAGAGNQIIGKKKVPMQDEIALKPSLLGHNFITSLPANPFSQAEVVRMEALKQEVKGMLRGCCSKAHEVVAGMRLVDAVQRLGVAYHFQEELDDALRCLSSYSGEAAGADQIFAVSLRFRLLRQAGIRVPSAVFDKFKGGNGKFNDNMRTDAEGLLSLYNAAYLKTHGETTLEEAISFAQENLKSMSDNLRQPLKDQMKRYLDVPLWRTTRRLEMRYYISEYEMDDNSNAALLELAKLDFNRVQSLHLNELRTLSLWWKEKHETGKIRFTRDRAVEGYLWVMAIVHEPQWAQCRTFTTLLFLNALILDDVVDNYATPNQFQTLNNAMQMWVLSEGKDDEVSLELEFLDYIFKLITVSFKSLENILKPEDKNRIAYMRRALGDYCAAQVKEMEMLFQENMPSFNSHLEVTLVTGWPSIFVAFAVGCGGDQISEDALRWIVTTPEELRECSKLLRYLNDVCNREIENDHERHITTIGCYVEEYGVSWHKAVAAFKNFSEDVWSTLNQALLEPGPEIKSSPMIAQLLIDSARVGVLRN